MFASMRRIFPRTVSRRASARLMAHDVLPSPGPALVTAIVVPEPDGSLRRSVR
jgi:hypothetical protein